MIGHKSAKYYDIRSKGIEYIRKIYLYSGLSLVPNSEEQKIKEVIQEVKYSGLNPREILKPEIFQKYDQLKGLFKPFTDAG